MKKKSELLKVNRQQLLDLHELVHSGKISREDLELVKTLIVTLLTLFDAFQQKTQSLERLMKLVFGARTEKKKNLFKKQQDKQQEDDPDDKGPQGGNSTATKEGQKSKGHGRRKVDEYIGSQKVSKKIHQWCSEQLDQHLVEPNSGLGKAIGYVLRHWGPLTHFLRKPGVPLDNNACYAARGITGVSLYRSPALLANYSKNPLPALFRNSWSRIFAEGTQTKDLNPVTWFSNVSMRIGSAPGCG
jgi:hypothetical protein